MKQMQACAGCGVFLPAGAGPHGRVEHGCVARVKGAASLIRDAADDPGLTPSRATVELFRVVLAQASEGEPVDPRAVADMIKGAAELEKAGGTDDLSSLIKEWAREE